MNKQNEEQELTHPASLEELADVSSKSSNFSRMSSLLRSFCAPIGRLRLRSTRQPRSRNGETRSPTIHGNCTYIEWERNYVWYTENKYSKIQRKTVLTTIRKQLSIQQGIARDPSNFFQPQYWGASDTRSSKFRGATIAESWREFFVNRKYLKHIL